ncbi:hypothetical protein ALQ20_04701 [Pseudomonas syringae pv. atrofaciens]|nr:hypothetical protein ALQ20_04701 [Pseudomonas syringae pv. atrofaciens]
MRRIITAQSRSGRLRRRLELASDTKPINQTAVPEGRMGKAARRPAEKHMDPGFSPFHVSAWAQRLQSGQALELLHHFADSGDVAAADDQCIAIEPSEEQLEMPQRGALQPFYSLAGHQRIAVNAHETIAELVFQRFERFVQQHFAALVTQGHVLVIGDKVDHLIQGNQLDAFAGARADMAAWA